MKYLYSVLVSALLIGACASSPLGIEIGVPVVVPPAMGNSAGRSQGECTTSHDCPTGYLCTARNVCSGTIFLKKERPPRRD